MHLETKKETQPAPKCIKEDNKDASCIGSTTQPSNCGKSKVSKDSHAQNVSRHPGGAWHLGGEPQIMQLKKRCAKNGITQGPRTAPAPALAFSEKGSLKKNRMRWSQDSNV